MMVESYANVADTMKYFGTRERPGAHFPFNFNLMGVDNETTAGEIKLEINKWLDNIPSFGHSNWVVSDFYQFDARPESNARVFGRSGTTTNTA